MDKTNSLNREMLRLMREVFNSVELAHGDTSDLVSIMEEVFVNMVTFLDAESLVRVLRAQDWIICPPLSTLLESASGGDGEPEEHEKIKVGGTCVE